MEAANLIEETPTPRNLPRLELLFLSLAASPALADACFWRSNPRLSVGVFALGLTGLILLNRPGKSWTKQSRLLVALLCGAALESAIDLCISNVLVTLGLILAIAGETHFRQLPNGWSRWSEQLWTMAKTPARWLALTLEVKSRPWEGEAPRNLSWRRLAHVAWIAAPGLVLVGIYSAIFGNGNALFAKLVGDWANAIYRWLEQLDIDAWRFTFWGFTTVMVLPLLWPSRGPKGRRIWSRELPQLPAIGSTATTRLQFATMLGLLNGLFFFVNTLDAVYLWMGRGQTLPPGVTATQFVHQGVWSLIIAVIFSAMLLSGVFHQNREVSSWAPLRVLGLVWIAQNLFLLASVGLRVKMYVDSFNLTVTRVNLVFFLALVATGFVLLAIYTWKQRTLGWLLNANMLATFFLFYTVQFLDTPAYVARYNVNLWMNAKDGRDLDMAYLKSLGPPAYQALREVAESDKPVSHEAAAYLREQQDELPVRWMNTSWASWQWRTNACERMLLSAKIPVR